MRRILTGGSRRMNPKSDVASSIEDARANGNSRGDAERLQRPLLVEWANRIDDVQWTVYERIMRALQRANVPFAIGGGLAFSHYSDRWRDTKDLDLYVFPVHRERVVQILSDNGLKDYHEVLGYDRSWIYRSYDPQADNTIVDVIWEMANHRTQVDSDWLERGQLTDLRGVQARLLPPEELIWAKLYIVQRDRCDWGDLLNIIYVQGEKLDWAHLLMRVGPDKPVVAALLSLFGWLAPEKAAQLPRALWDELGLSEPTAGPTSRAVQQQRVDLIDSRDWFGPK